uniref:CRAL-TRIO domain-containing protein n=1 Tax=Caenorhabditis tropicalis TaxID=1561998 RepID=A0A1I7URM2_9PELO
MTHSNRKLLVFVKNTECSTITDDENYQFDPLLSLLDVYVETFTGTHMFIGCRMIKIYIPRFNVIRKLANFLKEQMLPALFDIQNIAQCLDINTVTCAT